MLHNIQQWLNIKDCMKKLHFAHFGRKLAPNPSHEHLIQFAGHVSKISEHGQEEKELWYFNGMGRATE